MKPELTGDYPRKKATGVMVPEVCGCFLAAEAARPLRGALGPGQSERAGSVGRTGHGRLGCVRIGWGPGSLVYAAVYFGLMGQITKKALEAARDKFLREHAVEIEALAAVEVVESSREKITAERDDAVKKITEKFAKESGELDLELAVAIASARESMTAKKLASAIGISVERQKKLLDLLEDDADGTDRSNTTGTAEKATDPDDKEPAQDIDNKTVTTSPEPSPVTT